MINMRIEDWFMSFPLETNLLFSIPKFKWASQFQFLFKSVFYEINVINDFDFLTQEVNAL